MTPEQAAALSAPFDADEIELLPKPYNRDAQKGKCKECGGFHGLPAVHLHYVGHAGVTMRLNSVDPDWNWESMGTTETGTPLFCDGGLWIRLTVCGVTRIGFGDAAGKHGTNAVKEIIGDAIRNAAMRFGVGTYLWSKSEKAQALATRQGAELDDDVRDDHPSRSIERTQPSAPAEDAWTVTKPPQKRTSTALHATLNDAGITEREAKLAFCGEVAGHEIESSNDLTEAEAKACIQAAKARVDEIAGGGQ